MKYFFWAFIFIATVHLSGKVIKIADGDTFTILLPDNKKERIRLYGIDAPENSQPFSKNAKQFLSNLIFEKKVRLEIKDTDRYKRIVAIVYVNDTININESLLNAGLAWHYKEFDKNLRWDTLEQNARKKKIGLWADKNAIAPWQWRKKH